MRSRGKLSRGKLRLLVSVVGLVTSVGLSAALMPACYGRECDGDFVNWGPSTDLWAASQKDGGPDASSEPTLAQGHLTTDPNTWESNAMGEPWLPYPHSRTWILSYPQLGQRQPDQVTAYISADPLPNTTDQATLTQAGGNVAKWVGVLPPGARVANNTCADFYIRAVVHAPPFADAGAAKDASVGDASVSDGATDAGTD